MSSLPSEGGGRAPLDLFRECRAMRAFVRVAERPELVFGRPGVLLVHALPQHRMPGLILLTDEPGTGSLSATRYGMVMLMALRAELGDLQPDTSNVCVESGEGGFEHLVLTWRDCIAVESQRVPVRWPDTEPGSAEALLGVFGIQGRRVLATKGMLQRNPWRPRFP